MAEPALVRWRSYGSDRLDDFRAAGHRDRDVFPHRALYLPRAAPDGFQLAQRAGLRPAPDRVWEITIFAAPAALDGLPLELFRDDDVMWHRRDLGIPGHVAVASVTVSRGVAYTAAHHSDLVQRISRRRSHKTRVEKRFKGWDRMLLNAVLAFALERGIPTVRVPIAAQAMRQIDRTRHVQPELFARVYDRHVRDRYAVQRDGPWWSIDVAANRDRIVVGSVEVERRASAKTICIAHDLERGLGHRDTEPAFATAAEAGADANLAAMLEAEAEAGISATYNVVGTVLPVVQPQLTAAGHCLGFHSYAHTVERRWTPLGSRAAHRQLRECRRVDYRVKGYRPPQSRLGPSTDEARLARFNFEWLASSVDSLGLERPRMERGIVKIPIRLDDYPLHRARPYDAWEADLLDAARRDEFLAVSLHDCYAPRWIERYPEVLRRLADLGELKTMDEVAAEVTLRAAV